MWAPTVPTEISFGGPGGQYLIWNCPPATHFAIFVGISDGVAAHESLHLLLAWVFPRPALPTSSAFCHFRGYFRRGRHPRTSDFLHAVGIVGTDGAHGNFVWRTQWAIWYADLPFFKCRPKSQSSLAIISCFSLSCNMNIIKICISEIIVYISHLLCASEFRD